MARILSNIVPRRFASRLIYGEYGQPDSVVKLEHFEPPTSAKDDKVVVRMLASPVNPSDINVIQGVYAIKPPLPAVGGGEGVGEVLHVGDKVKNLQPGDRVFPAGNVSGTWLTHATYSESDLVKVRNDLSLVMGATMRVNPATAYRMLKDFVQLDADDYVIQNGANSAVGAAVIEIAKTLGVKTVNIVRDRPDIDELKEELTSLGADYVWTEDELRKKIPEFRENRLAKPKLALNCVGGQSSTELLQTLGQGGCHVTYGAMSMKPVTVSSAALIFQDVSVRGFWLSKWLDNHMAQPDMYEMYDLLALMAIEGKLNPPKNLFVPLSEYAEVMKISTTGFKKGKYIFDLSS